MLLFMLDIGSFYSTGTADGQTIALQWKTIDLITPNNYLDS